MDALVKAAWFPFSLGNEWQKHNGRVGPGHGRVPPGLSPPRNLQAKGSYLPGHAVESRQRNVRVGPNSGPNVKRRQLNQHGLRLFIRRSSQVVRLCPVEFFVDIALFLAKQRDSSMTGSLLCFSSPALESGDRRIRKRSRHPMPDTRLQRQSLIAPRQSSLRIAQESKRRPGYVVRLVGLRTGHARTAHCH